MIKILLVCNAGMSTAMLARKMVEAGNGEVQVDAKGLADYAEFYQDYDILLIGPQIRFQANEIKGNVNIPVYLIPPQKYGIMDAKGILADVKKELGEV